MVNVPWVTVIALEDMFKLSPSVKLLLVLFKVTVLNNFPAVIRVDVLAKVTVPVCVYVMPLPRVTFPFTVILLEPVKVPVKPVKFRLNTLVVAVIVQVTAPDAASK